MRQGRANRICKFAAEFGLGMTVAICMVVLAQSNAGPGLGPLIVLGLLLATVVLHEAGHVIASAAQGCRVIGVGIGPLIFERRRRGFRVHVRKVRIAGFVLSIPDFSRDVRVQWLVVVAAGPAANLVAALVLIAVVLSMPGSYTAVGKAMVWAAAVLNAAVGTANLLPYEASIASDGARLLRWLRNPDRDDLQLLKLYDDSLNGRIASEYAPEEITSLEASANLQLSMLGTYLALRAAQQRHDRHAFDAVLERMRARVEAFDKATYARMRNLWVMFLLEEAFERARSGDAAAVDRFMTDYGAFVRPQRHRLDAARHLAANDVERAARSIERARSEAAGTYDAAWRRAGAAIVADLEQELARRRQAVAVGTA